jgi:hypothetical protein
MTKADNSFEKYDEQLQGRCQYRRKVQHNTWLVRNGENAIGVVLHNTTLVTFHRDGSVELDTGGWRSVTTADRMRSYSPFRIVTVDGDWHIMHPDAKGGPSIPLIDNMILKRKKNDGAYSVTYANLLKRRPYSFYERQFSEDEIKKLPNVLRKWRDDERVEMFMEHTLSMKPVCPGTHEGKGQYDGRKYRASKLTDGWALEFLPSNKDDGNHLHLDPIELIRGLKSLKIAKQHAYRHNHWDYASWNYDYGVTSGRGTSVYDLI